MTTKQYWHKAWQRDGAGLLHGSGLQAQINTEGAWVARPACLPAWQAFEQASGVPAHQLPARLARLLKEAALWRDPDARRADLDGRAELRNQQRARHAEGQRILSMAARDINGFVYELQKYCINPIKP